MDLYIKHFSQLNVAQLHAIYYIRTAVFVVEQSCPYQEVDEIDKIATHLWLQENDEILAYCRIYPDKEIFHIGRVLTARRKERLGSKILQEAITYIKKENKAKAIEIEAQSYARKFYEKQGFKRISKEFMEDGIPHITMRLELEDE